MDRIRTTNHDGKEILVVDYCGLDAVAYKSLMAEAFRSLSARSPGSALVLTKVKGTRFAVGATEDIKAYSAAIRPYVKASAVVGLSTLQRVIYMAVKPFLTTGIESFGTEAEAKVWLARQG